MQSKRRSMTVLLVLMFMIMSFAHIAHAQDATRALQNVWRAKVVEVTSEKKSFVAGSNKILTLQGLRAEILEGDKKGKTVIIENDFRKLKVGDTFLLNYYINNGVEVFTVNERDRWPGIIGLILLLVLVMCWLAGWRGFRAFLSLGVAFLAIFYVVLPALLHGWSPVLTSSGIAIVILLVTIFFTNGFNRESAAACSGAIIAILVTAILASISVYVMKLTGFSSEESLSLNSGMGQQLDFVGLLLGGIIIGVLGMLENVALTQVGEVRDIVLSDKSLSSRQIYAKALSKGKKPMGTLVNALALAYIGMSLPILTLASMSEYGLPTLVNQEVLIGEIIRAVTGGIGLILTVPITTILAIHVFKIGRKDHKSEA